MRVCADFSPFNTSKTVIIIPCFNEAKRLKPSGLQEAIHNTVGTNFLFINDGSTDSNATINLLKSFKRRHNDRVDFANLSQNSGKSEAIRYGYKLALGQNPALIGFFDADEAVRFSEINSFIDIFKHSNEAHAVIGVRSKLAGHKIERNGAKFLSQKIIVMLARRLGIPVTTDTQCGAKLFDAKQVAQVIDKPFISSRWLGCDIEFLKRLTDLPENRGNKNWLYEYPVSRWSNIDKSTRSANSYLLAFADYIKIFAQYQIKHKFRG